MAGLFDQWGDSPNSQAELAMIAGLLGGKGNLSGILGQALTSSQGAYNQANEAAQKKQLQDMQMKLQQQQLQAGQQSLQSAQTQAEQEAQRRTLAPQFYQSPQTQVLAAGGKGPTPLAASQIATTPPKFDVGGYANALLGRGDIGGATGAMGLEKSDLIPLKSDEGLYSRSQNKVIASGPPKQDDFQRSLTAAGIMPGTPQYQQLMGDWLRKQSTHQPPVNVQVNTEKGLYGEIANKLGASVADTRDAAMQAPQTVASIDRVMSALDSGKVIAGPGAAGRTALTQVASMMFPGTAPEESLIQTRRAINGMAQLTLDSRQALKGQGAISEGEGALLQRARSGDVENMTVPELKEVMRIMRDKQAYLIKQHNQNAKAVGTNPAAAPLTPFFQPIQEPAPYAAPSALGANSIDALLNKYK